MVFFYLFVILLQETVSVLAEKTEETCKQDVNCENIVESVKIHWDLNGLSQDDPVLIENIKNKVLWVVMKCLQFMPKNYLLM